MTILSISSPVHAAYTETTYYIHQDHLGSVIAVSDESGAVVSQEKYTPYGNTSAFAKATADEAGQIERKYTGQIKDKNTTLAYYNARYYDPVLSRFISADSINDQANRYNYVGGNPVMRNDPGGNMFDEDGGSDPWKEKMKERYADTDPFSVMEKTNLDKILEKDREKYDPSSNIEIKKRVWKDIFGVEPPTPELNAKRYELSWENVAVRGASLIKNLVNMSPPGMVTHLRGYQTIGDRLYENTGSPEMRAAVDYDVTFGIHAMKYAGSDMVSSPGISEVEQIQQQIQYLHRFGAKYQSNIEALQGQLARLQPSAQAPVQAAVQPVAQSPSTIDDYIYQQFMQVRTVMKAGSPENIAQGGKYLQDLRHWMQQSTGIVMRMTIP
ncbi:hypothetical protein MUP32_04810 [Candidatus Microgenomates bacterium]|nr:hypothetical protein [Candidatus Microgenomates bacterium]